LRDFWAKTPDQNPRADRINEALVQLKGLADALEKLHNFSDGPYDLATVPSNEDDAVNQKSRNDSIRHGDLKPENLLHFTNSDTELGTLKIADMGLAKQHILRTVNRKYPTTTRYSTIQYQAPEAATTLQGGLSRLYDLWSMGCIIFEFIIWLLHGNTRLELFYTHLQGATHQACSYFELSPTSQGEKAKVHHVVLQWMDHLQKYEPECIRDSALRDLLILVRQRLLVVDLPPARGRTLRSDLTESNHIAVIHPPESDEEGSRFRATAEMLCRSLADILSKVSNPHYLLTGAGRNNVGPPTMLRSQSSFLFPGMGTRTIGNTSTNNNTQAPAAPAQIRVSALSYSVCS
jgi:serine/threonine protein kinase